MATKEQKERAKQHVEEGKKVVLHTTKLTVRQRAKLTLERAEVAKSLLAWIDNEEFQPGWTVKHYPVEDGVSWVYYLKQGTYTHTLSVDFRRQTMTLYADPSFGGIVKVCRDLDQLREALSLVCF